MSGSTWHCSTYSSCEGCAHWKFSHFQLVLTYLAFYHPSHPTFCCLLRSLVWFTDVTEDNTNPVSSLSFLGVLAMMVISIYIYLKKSKNVAVLKSTHTSYMVPFLKGLCFVQKEYNAIHSFHFNWIVHDSLKIVLDSNWVDTNLCVPWSLFWFLKKRLCSVNVVIQKRIFDPLLSLSNSRQQIKKTWNEQRD